MVNSTQVTKSADNGKKGLSKEAKRFNSLMEQIKKKEKKLEEINNQLDKSLAQYHEQVLPLVKAWSKERIHKLIALSQHLRTEPMSNFNLDLLMRYVFDECSEIDELQVVLEPESELLEEELRQLDRFLIIKEGGNPDEEQKSKEEERVARLNKTKAYFIEKMKEVGVELNLDEVHEGLSDQEIEIRLQNLVHEATERASISAEEPPVNNRKKSKKQLEKEEALKRFDESKENSLSGLYKKLAKLLHPDTSTDEESRDEKSELMKRLSAAYQAKDLKTMLVIEMEWLKVESNKIELLSEEHLAYYNSFLSKQVNELQQQILALPYEPRFSPLTYFIGDPSNYKFWNLTTATYDIMDNISDEKKRLEELNGTVAKKKKAIKAFIKDQMEMEEAKRLFNALDGWF